MKYSQHIRRRVDINFVYTITAQSLGTFLRASDWLAKFLEEEVNPSVKVVSHKTIHAKPQKPPTPQYPEARKKAKSNNQSKKKK
jgi:hypothetical protein